MVGMEPFGPHGGVILVTNETSKKRLLLIRLSLHPNRGRLSVAAPPGGGGGVSEPHLSAAGRAASWSRCPAVSRRGSEGGCPCCRPPAGGSVDGGGVVSSDERRVEASAHAPPGPRIPLSCGPAWPRPAAEGTQSLIWTGGETGRGLRHRALSETPEKDGRKRGKIRGGGEGGQEGNKPAAAST